MIRDPGHVARTLRRDLQLLDDLAAVCQQIDAWQHAPLPGRCCPTCGGLRTRGAGTCDVCITLRRLDLIDEVEHLIGTDNPESIARRLGYSEAKNLCRTLTRIGRYDLARRLDIGTAA